MKTTVFPLLLILLSAFNGCAYLPGGAKVFLVLPDSFKGDIFLLEDTKNGTEWHGQEIVVPPSRIVLIKDLSLLFATPPDEFRAKYLNGTVLSNSSLGGAGKVSSLWPILQATDNKGVRAFYFVVGSFHEKVQLENEKLDKWSDIKTVLPAR